MPSDAQDADEVYHHAPGSRVVHDDRDCHHLDNANEVEELDADEADKYRTCKQCAYDRLSYSEKMERRRKSRRSRKTTVRIRR